MAIPSSATPYVDDEEDGDESLYSVGANDSSDSKLGPDGDGDATNNGSAMPQYSSRDSGATNSENNAPAMSGGKSAGADPLAGSLYEAPPQAPSYQKPDRSQYQRDRAQMQQDAKPIDRKSVKPSAWDYIHGGLVGALQGAAGHDDGSGGRIVNHRANDAIADQKSRVDADKDVIAGDRQDLTDDATDQEGDRKFYETNLQNYTANQNAKNQQWDRDRTNRQDTQSQTNWNAEDTERKGRDQYTQTHDDAVSEETRRHNKATENDAVGNIGIRSREVSVQEKRLTDEENDTANGLPRRGSASDQRLRAQNEQKYRGMRKNSFDALNYGDPKAADEYHQKGYQQSLKELQNSAENPDTGEAWKPGEQDAAVKNLQQRHVSELNRAEEDYVENMRGMGYTNIQPIQFNERGEAITDSSGKPTGQGPQQQQQQKQSPGAPQQAQQQAPLRAPKSGVAVQPGQIVPGPGGQPVRITGVNPKTGKLTWQPVGQGQ